MLSKKIILSLVTILLIGSVASFFVYQHNQTNDRGSSANSSPYSGPSKDEQVAGNSQKDQTLKEEDSRNNSEQQNKQITSVVITDAAQYGDTIEVRAFMPDHYQDGTCTITLTQGNKKVEKSTSAYRDASTTICTNPLFPHSEFASSGDWNVVVTYTSDTTRGVSESRVIKIE
jgi:hypothetical protein